VRREQQPADVPVTARSTIVLIMSGVKAASLLSFETGVHRVQRVPADERQGRVHTSSASVIVRVSDQRAGSELSSHNDRSEKIRTYNFPDDRVTDHRIRLTVPGVAEVLDGDLDPIIDGLLGR